MTGMDFMIHGIYSYEFFGETVWITTSHVCVLIVLLVLLGFALAANRKIPARGEGIVRQRGAGGMVNFLELLVEKLDDMVEHAMGIHAPAFVNYIGTVFLFLLCSNVSGLFGLRPPTADYGTTLALALMTFVLIWTVRIRHQRPGRIWGELCSPLPVLASAVGSGQSDQRAGDTDLPVLEAVCQRAVRDRHACAGLWAAPGDRPMYGRLLFTRTLTCFPGRYRPMSSVC